MQNKKLVYEELWFLIIFLIIFPPLGIAILWRQGRFKTLHNILITIGSVFYFFLPFLFITLLIAFTETPLFHSHDEFKTKLNYVINENELPFEITNEQLETHSNSFNLSENLTIIENLEEDGDIEEIILVSQGSGSESVLAMTTLIKVEDEYLTDEEVNTILNELNIFNKEFNFNESDSKYKDYDTQYTLKYSDKVGYIFTISELEE